MTTSEDAFAKLVTYPDSDTHTEAASTAKAGEAGAPGETITLKMADEGALILSRLKDDLADGEVSLRDVAVEVYRAMHRPPLSTASTEILPRQYRGQYSASAYLEMIRTPLDPAQVVLPEEK